MRRGRLDKRAGFGKVINMKTENANTAQYNAENAAGMADRWGRKITYLRLSVTDRCDFRCQYCMPLQTKFLPKRMILSLEECLLVARAFAELGAGKIRITGGEPLVRPNVAWLCGQISALPGVRETTITTNGSQLPKLADELCRAGVGRVNISLDTLDAEKFRALTRTGDLQTVLDGIAAARAAGFPGGVKLNAVLIRGVNDGELAALAEFAFAGGMDISFIEEMPLGDAGYRRADTYYSADDALARLRRRFRLRALDYDSGGPARYWQAEGGGKIGMISPHTHNFCETCNRVRVSAAGRLYPCLGQNESADLLDAVRENSLAALKLKIREAMEIKPKGHDFDIYAGGAKVVRFMSATGG
ncbi:MAG: GTP 3',8-cyclase MoaA [Gammaproteobacteria bacterium]